MAFPEEGNCTFGGDTPMSIRNHGTYSDHGSSNLPAADNPNGLGVSLGAPVTLSTSNRFSPHHGPSDSVTNFSTTTGNGESLAVLSGATLPGDPAFTWTGGGDGVSWTDKNNWGGSGYPGPNDSAFFNSTAPATITDSGQAQYIGDEGPLTVSGGSVTAKIGNATAIVIANTGSGSLVVQGGGSLYAGNSSYILTPLAIAAQSGSQGTLTATGSGSSVTANNPSDVGIYGTAHLNVLGGATVTVNAQVLGPETGLGGLGLVAPNSHGSGYMTISGAGSTFITHTDGLGIGASGTGSALVEQGGQLTVNGNFFGGGMQIGDLAGAKGSLAVTDSGSGVTVNGGFFQIGVYGSAGVTILNGATITSIDGYIGSGTSSQGSAVVSGADSRWNVTYGTYSAPLFIGDYGTGSLTVANGATVASGYGVIAAGTSSLGSATITGAGALWTTVYGTVGGAIFVGGDSSGTMTVANGATVSSGYGFIGYFGAGQGGVTITDAGSRWDTNGLGMVVGNLGTGGLTVLNQATVSSGNAFIGSGSSCQGTALVSGAGSLWTMVNGTAGAQLAVGEYGTGSLTIASNATVASGDGFIGVRTGSHGTATVGGGGVWTLSNGTSSAPLTVGYLGTGNLTIGAGGTVVGSGITIGSQPGGSGTASVSGAGALLSDSGNLVVGGQGHGELTIASSGSVAVAGSIDVGASVGSSGTIDLAEGGVLDAPPMIIGDAGAGVLLVPQHGRLFIPATPSGVIFGNQATGTGSLELYGPDSQATIEQTTTLGNRGTGHLYVQGGGEFLFSVNLEAAVAANSHAVATISAPGIGANTIQGNLDLGIGGTGEWTMNQGALLDVVGAINLGVSTGSQGTVTLSDAGTALTSGTGNVTVGGAGTGTVEVHTGAVFDASSCTVVVASTAGSTGTVTVDGAGSAFEASTLTVGSGGNGTADISDGGTLTSSGSMVVGQQGSSNGEVTVTGAGSTLDLIGPGANLTVGSAGTGDLTLSDGAAATIGGTAISLGSSSGGDGSLTIENSYLGFVGSVTVGSAGSGKLDVDQGGTFNVNGAIKIASSITSDGTLTVDGLGSEVISNQSLTVGGVGAAAATISSYGLLETNGATLGSLSSTNTQTVNLDSGGEWVDANTLTVGKNAAGAVTVDSGALVNVLGNVTVAASSGVGGTVTVEGTLAGTGAGSTFEYGAALIVGNGGPGDLSVETGGIVMPGTGNTTGAVEIAAAGRGRTTSQITVTGAGSQLIANAIDVGGTPTKSGGSGSLTVTNSGTATTGSLLIYRGDAVQVTGPSAGSSGGILDIGSGGLSGSGTVTIANAGQVLVAGSAASTATIVFNDGDSDLLNLSAPLGFASTIKGFQTGDGIDLLNTPANAFTFAHGQLTVTNNGTAVAVLNLSGHYTSSQFTIASDTHGGTMVTVNTGTVVLAPAVVAASSYIPFASTTQPQTLPTSGTTITQQGMLMPQFGATWHPHSG
jgi:fibronectin-binding autotransporter adhesin